MHCPRDPLHVIVACNGVSACDESHSAQEFVGNSRRPDPNKSNRSKTKARERTDELCIQTPQERDLKLSERNKKRPDESRLDSYSPKCPNYMLLILSICSDGMSAMNGDGSYHHLRLGGRLTLLLEWQRNKESSALVIATYSKRRCSPSSCR